MRFKKNRHFSQKKYDQTWVTNVLLMTLTYTYYKYFEYSVVGMPGSQGVELPGIIVKYVAIRI